ncbi:MAG: histidine kinase [Candidatus Sulfotelmatobacter sp.]|jgi:hypothetical protein
MRGIARAYLMSIGFWCGFALLMGLQYTPLDRQHFWTWLSNLIIKVALLGSALAFWTPPVFYLVGKYLRLCKNRFRYLLFWSLGAVPFVALHTSIIWVLIPPYDDALQKYTSRSFQSWVEMIRSNFADQIFIYTAIVVAAHAYEYLKRLRQQERERYEYQQALAASELQVLKMQIHPHFLFNTLHGIATLIEHNPNTSKAMIIKLSSLLRTSLDRDSSDLIPLEEELRFVKDYLDLETMRFGSRLKIRWSIAPGICRLLVPQMLLQPLVENSIQHGVASAREGGWIEISANVENGLLLIQIRNSVGGKTSTGSGLGLRNAEARLKYLYSGDANLRLTIAEDHTATVRLCLPALNSHCVIFAGPRAYSTPEKGHPLSALGE